MKYLEKWIPSDLAGVKDAGRVYFAKICTASSERTSIRFTRWVCFAFGVMRAYIPFLAELFDL